MAYQDQRRVVVLVACVDVDALGDELLARLLIAPPTGLAEQAEVVAEVQWVFLLELPRRDGLRLGSKGSLELVLFLDIHGWRVHEH